MGNGILTMTMRTRRRGGTLIEGIRERNSSWKDLDEQALPVLLERDPEGIN